MAIDSDRLRAALADRYVIEGEIGRGGMAAVYLALDTKHHRKVALKVLLPDLAAALGAERFLREIETAANLSHPHILALYDSGKAAGFLYFVMPYVEGESLKERLEREGRLPVAEALRIARQVADGLGHAHRNGIVHRDIKPGNILLSEGHAIIADFGIAKALAEAGADKVTQTGIAVGSPTYMSPEQATGEDVDARSDIFSLGCVSYEMLAGRPPFQGATALGVMASRLASRPPPLRKLRSAVPAGAVAAVEWALETDPAQRCPTAKQLVAALEGEVTHRSAAKRRRRRLVGAAAGVVLVGAALALVRQTTTGSRADVAPVDLLPPTAIAVLPFSDRSPSRDYGWLASGLTDELIAALSQVEVLTVKSSAATRPFQQAGVTIDSLARALSVGTVIAGWLEVVRADLRVTVQLIDAQTGAQIGDLVRVRAPPSHEDSLRERMVDQVAVAMRIALGEKITLDRWRRESESANAWELVQRSEEGVGLAEESRWSGDVRAAFEILSAADSLAGAAAVDAPEWIEPVLLQGWISQGFARIAESIGGDSTVGGQLRSLESTAFYIRRGLALAEDAAVKWPGESRVLELRGALHLDLRDISDSGTDSLLALAITDLQEALALDPRLPRAWVYLSQAKTIEGSYSEAADAAERALKSDAYFAVGPEPLTSALFAFLRQGDFESAQQVCRAGQLRFSAHTNFMECELLRLGWGGSGEADVDAAWRELARIESGNPDPMTWRYRRLMVAAVLARSEFRDSALALVNRTRDSVPEENAHYFTEAFVHNTLGDLDLTLESLEKFLATSPQYLDYMRNHPWFENIRDDPRFQQMVATAASS